MSDVTNTYMFYIFYNNLGWAFHLENVSICEHQFQISTTTLLYSAHSFD